MTPEQIAWIGSIVAALFRVAPDIASAIIDTADPETRAQIVALQIVRDARAKLPATGATRAGVDAIFARQTASLAPPAMPLPTDTDETESGSSSDEGDGA